MSNTITFEQQQAISSLNRVWAVVEMITRTFAEDEDRGSREKLLASLYMLEDMVSESKAKIAEVFS